MIEGAAAVVHATLQEREFIAALARATLDGVFDGVPATSPAMAGLLERFRAELESGAVSGRHDPRIIVACLSSATAGYALLGRYIRHGVGLDTEPDEPRRGRDGRGPGAMSRGSPFMGARTEDSAGDRRRR